MSFAFAVRILLKYFTRKRKRYLWRYDTNVHVSIFLCNFKNYQNGGRVKNNVKVPVKLTLSVIAACLVSFCGLITETAVNIAFCIILEQIPFEKVGTYMGYGALVSEAAPALGPTYGGIVNQTLGWRYIFVMLIPVLIFTLIIFDIFKKQKYNKFRTSGRFA